jgi:iron-sulfur cluster repair protein YtfE (RIC family)
MNAVDRLKRDHTILRSKLDVLQSALAMGPETWYVLREVCFTLSRQIRDHIKREEALVARCRKAMTPKALAEVAVEHKDEPAHLRTINRLFVTEHGHSLERIKPALTEVIQGLRRHMDEEERELFPIFERVLGEREPAAAEPTAKPCHVDETMTVNRIVQEFPRTKPVFEQLFVNLPYEGCHCLDEVAWRHGMESQQLLHALEDVIEACECQRAAKN